MYSDYFKKETIDMASHSTSVPNFIREQDLTYSDEYQEKATEAVIPERNLLSAMMARAIYDAFGSAGVTTYNRSNARHWIFCELQPEFPFTFAWTAIELGINPTWLQNSLISGAIEPSVLAQKIHRIKN